MSHATITDSSYGALAERLNRLPQGAPPSELLFRILRLLFSEREAALVALLPIRPFTVRAAARAWGMREAEARTVLDELASRALLLDMEGPNGTLYILPPPMAGFFEFSMMRVRGDIDQKLLARAVLPVHQRRGRLHHRPVHGGETQLGRVFVNEPALERRAQAAARSPHGRQRPRPGLRARQRGHRDRQHIGVGLCYCRHKMAASWVAPATRRMDICMTFNGTADSLDPPRLRPPGGPWPRAWTCSPEAYDANLVQFGENVQRDVNFICNCCGCCCEAMIAAAPVRPDAPGPHHQLPAGRRRRAVQRLRQVRQRLPGGGDDAGLGQRPAAPRSAEAQLATRTCAWAAASARATCTQCGAAAGATPEARDHAGRHGSTAWC